MNHEKRLDVLSKEIKDLNEQQASLDADILMKENCLISIDQIKINLCIYDIYNMYQMVRNASDTEEKKNVMKHSVFFVFMNSDGMRSACREAKL